MYSIALCPRCFKWKMLRLSVPKALLYLQLLISLITRYAVNARAISNGFLLVSLVTIRVSLEEVCLPSYEVLNCWLNLVASCMDDENEIPLNVIASFRSSELSVDRVCHEQEVMREVDANETSGGTLVGLSQLSIPKLDPLIESSILFSLVSVDLEYHDGWCALKSPRIRVSGVVRRRSIED